MKRIAQALWWRNPKTGEVIPVSARRVVTFRAGDKLNASVERAGEPNKD